MKRSVVLTAVLALLTAGVALAYQAVSRDREYRTLVTRGDNALRDEQTFGAIEAYSGAIALRPESLLARLRRAETYRRRGDRGDLDQAARDLRAAAALDPTATRPLEELGDVLYQLERYPQASEMYVSYLRLDDRSSRVSYKLALTHYRSGNLDAAAAIATQLLSVDNKMTDAHYLLGMCLRDKRRNADAVQAFATVVALAPESIPAREELADLYAGNGHTTGELDQLQAIARLDRTHIERQVTLGLAEARAGRPEAAVQTLGNALDRAPDRPFIYAALGRVWLDVAQNRSDQAALGKALEALGRVAAGAAATSEVLTLFGRALLQDGQGELAERVLQQATTRYPIDPAAFLWYATAAEKQAHLDAARDALVRYGGLVSGDAAFVSRATRIAALSLRLGDARTAAEWLHQAVDTAPNDVPLFASLVDAELKAGDREAAQAALDRGLKQDPANPALLTLARRVASAPAPSDRRDRATRRREN